MRFNSLRSLLFTRVIAFLAIAISFLIAATASAEDIYVNNASGDDKNNGQNIGVSSSNAGPVRSINQALKLAAPGDRIIVQKTDLPYYECLSLEGKQLSGVGRVPLQIVAEKGVILDGSRKVPLEEWQFQGDGVFRFLPELLHHQQLYLDGKPANRISPVVKGEVPELQPTEWSLVDGWIYFKVADGRAPFHYDLRYCFHQTGITLYNVDNVAINGLTVQGFQLDGINAHDTVSKCNIVGCMLRGNGRSGLSVGGASRVTIANSIAGANGTAQLRTEGYCKLEITSCRLLESAGNGPALVNDGGTVTVDGNLHQGDSTTMARNIRSASFRLKPRREESTSQK